ncbi:MAG TPA: extradiol dioxygenase [Methyloceanibacter sp.]|nr:extradiol dioxygenase [Methyloceanibacter sp.]
MINGAHIVITSKKPAADHAFLRDVLKLPHINEGGYLIFALPPAEMSVHEADKDGEHEVFFLCEDVKAFIAEMRKRSIACSAVKDQGWGLLTQLTLPGGGKLGVYQARHARPKM